ncbi:MAG: LLM class flavin-dependent oxidoreductase [Actinomycetota bacterium]
MRFGIGLPNALPGVAGGDLLDWARRAEAAGFASLATIDRLNFPTYDSLATLAAVAGATERIGLLSNVLLGPAYEPLVLARQTASLTLLSRGRLRLGLGIGARADDFEVTGKAFSDRGKRFDDLLETLHAAWRCDPLVAPVGPDPVALVPRPVDIPILVGGQPRFAAPRAARWNAAWTIGGGGLDLVARGIEVFREEWERAGGAGDPRFVARVDFSLGDDLVEESRTNLRAYYAFIGPHLEAVVESALRTPDAVRAAIDGYAALGVEELVFSPTAADPAQVERLAAIAFG